MSTTGVPSVSPAWARSSAGMTSRPRSPIVTWYVPFTLPVYHSMDSGGTSLVRSSLATGQSRSPIGQVAGLWDWAQRSTDRLDVVVEIEPAPKDPGMGITTVVGERARPRKNHASWRRRTGTRPTGSTASWAATLDQAGSASSQPGQAR